MRPCVAAATSSGSRAGFPSLIYEQNHNEAFVFSTKENKTTAAKQGDFPVQVLQLIESSNIET